MSMITLEDVKTHLRIDASYTDEDAYIERLIVLSKAVVESEICGKISDMGVGEAEIAKQAMLLVIGDYYANREDSVIGTSTNALPRGVAALCRLIRNYEG